jgi:hypothetical protein
MLKFGPHLRGQLTKREFTTYLEIFDAQGQWLADLNEYVLLHDANGYHGAWMAGDGCVQPFRKVRLLEN